MSFAVDMLCFQSRASVVGLYVVLAVVKLCMLMSVAEFITVVPDHLYVASF